MNLKLTKTRIVELLVFVVMFAAMLVALRKYFVGEQELDPLFSTVTADTAAKCNAYADEHYIMVEAFGGKSRQALFRECVLDSNDPAFEAAAKAYTQKLREDYASR